MTMEPESQGRVRRQGPAMLRGRAIPKTTTDQRLLDRRGPSDWVHTDTWRVLRIQAEFVEGFGLLAEMGKAVSVFWKRLPWDEFFELDRKGAVIYLNNRYRPWLSAKSGLNQSGCSW